MKEVRNLLTRILIISPQGKYKFITAVGKTATSPAEKKPHSWTPPTSRVCISRTDGTSQYLLRSAPHRARQVRKGLTPNGPKVSTFWN